MKRERVLTHEFVEYIPNDLKDGAIYVSIPFATVAHKCCCGCGNEVITPLSPTDWTLIYDGQSISLDPSIGNWNFPCQSHYWINRNRVKWARRWSHQEINAGRAHDLIAKKRYFGGTKTSAVDLTAASAQGPRKQKPKRSPWRIVKKRLQH